MKKNKIKYNKLNNILCKNLVHINCLKNLKYINTYNTKHFIYYEKTANYIKNLIKSSICCNLNYKELINIKKKLKSGYLILSTSLGIMTDKKALLHKIGGIILYYIVEK